MKFEVRTYNELITHACTPIPDIIRIHKSTNLFPRPLVGCSMQKLVQWFALRCYSCHVAFEPFVLFAHLRCSFCFINFNCELSRWWWSIFLNCSSRFICLLASGVSFLYSLKYVSTFVYTERKCHAFQNKFQDQNP